MPPVYAFGSARLDRKRYALFTSAGVQRLTPTPFKLLVALLESNGRVVSKEELMDNVWSGRFVGESSLNRQISSLRKLLGDAPGQERYIATVPRVGYQWVPAVTILKEDSAEGHALRDGIPLRFIGRGREQTVIETALSRLRTGKGGLLCVTGDAGLGKTTFVRHVLNSLSRDQYYIGEARPEERLAGSGMYLPLRGLLGSLTRASKEVAGVARRQAAHWHNEQAPGSLAQRLKTEFWAFMRTLSRGRPVVVFLDDWHWADASSMELLASASAKLRDMPVLWILAYRSGEMLQRNSAFAAVKEDLQTHGCCWELPLEGWSPEEIGAFLCTAFPDHRFPEELGSNLFLRTRGNPLFVIELLEHMRREGIIMTSARQWRLSPRLAEQRSVPESVRGLIQQKVQSLTDGERAVLTMASVQGAVFDSAVLARASGLHRLVVEDRLKSVEDRHEFVRSLGQYELPDGETSARYEFTHALYHEASYSTLMPDRRAAASRSVALSLIALYRNDSLDFKRQLGFLFEHAHDYGRASKYFFDAAEIAGRSGGFQEAVILGSRALEVLRRQKAGPETIENENKLLFGLAQWCWHIRSNESLTQAVAYCRQLIKRNKFSEAANALLASTYILQATYSLVSPEQVLPASRRAAMRALKLNPRNGCAHLALGFADLFRLDFRATAERFETALRCNSEFATAHQWYSLLQLVRGRPDEAIHMIRRAQQLEPSSLIISSQIGWMLYYCRRFNEAIEHLKNTLDLDPGFWRAYLNLGWCYLMTDNRTEALVALRKAVALNENATTLSILAYGYARLGMAAKAQATLDGLSRSPFATSYWRAPAQLYMGRREEAMDLLEESYRNREWFVIFLNVEPALDDLRNEPRFQRLVRKVGLQSC